jgi:hypothetical protein
MNVEKPTIIGVREYGPLTVVYLATDEGKTLMVPLDEIAFRKLLESERCSPAQLVGRRIDLWDRKAR